MSTLGPAFLALLIATAICALELVTTKYPRTFFLFTIRRCPALYIYSLIYGVIASMIVFTGILHVQSQININIWLQALLIGISIKAVFRIRFFSVPASTEGSASIPIGFETFVYILESWFLPTIDLSEFNSVRTFLKPWLEQYSDLDVVRQSFKRDLDKHYPALLTDLNAGLDDPDPDSYKKILDALETYLKKMGKESLVRAFPLETLGPARITIPQNK